MGLHIEGSFRAASAEGEEFLIHKVRSVIDVSHSEGVLRRPGRSGQLITSEGDAVTRIEHGRYLIVARGLEVTSDDPNAA